MKDEDVDMLVLSIISEAEEEKLFPSVDLIYMRAKQLLRSEIKDSQRRLIKSGLYKPRPQYRPHERSKETSKRSEDEARHQAMLDAVAEVVRESERRHARFTREAEKPKFSTAKIVKEYMAAWQNIMRIVAGMEESIEMREKREAYNRKRIEYYHARKGAIHVPAGM